MINGTISLLPKSKKIIICQKGVSQFQMNVIKDLGAVTHIYKDDELKKTVNIFSDDYNLDLLKHYEGFEIFVMVKNPYWRIFELYYNNFLFSYRENLVTFKEQISKIYMSEEFSHNKQIMKKHFFDVNLDLPYDYIRCENFKEDVYNKLGFEIDEDPNYMSLISPFFSLYFENSESLSDFFDLETATLIYQNNKKTFETFGYSFYSYLDFHSPNKKIHQLHREYPNQISL